MTPYLIAGALSGVAGLLVFLIIHHFWIQPIWFIFPVGLIIAAGGGLAVGWSYAEIHSALPPRPWTFLALSGLIGLILAPSIVLAQLREPLVDLALLAIPPGSGGRVVLHFFLELVLTAMVVGGALGWWLTRTPQATFATAVASLVYALGPGHNIPFLGGTPGVGKGIMLLVAITLIAALVLVEISHWLIKR